MIKHKVEKGETGHQSITQTQSQSVHHNHIFTGNQLETSAILIPQPSHHIMQTKQTRTCLQKCKRADLNRSRCGNVFWVREPN